MGKPVIGEVVILPFPQTNLQAGKRRPALVVADLKGDDLILCQITSQPRSDGYSVPLLAADFERGRLAVDSFIRPNRLFTVEQSVILYAAGKVTAARLRKCVPKSAASSRDPVRDLNFKYLAEGKGATVTARFGPDGITICDPNRVGEGAAAVFHRIYDRPI